MKTGRKPRHGMSKHPIMRAWINMRWRCNPKSHCFHIYGGRGIQVCERWQIFENFCEDMLPTWGPGLYLDRIDAELNYELSNCRWATKRLSGQNRRAVQWIDTPEGRLTLPEAAQRSGIPLPTVRSRMRAGRAVQEALTNSRQHRRTALWIDTPEGRITLAEAAKRMGIPYTTVLMRIVRWDCTPSEALTHRLNSRSKYT